jgi:hypothetical protein
VRRLLAERRIAYQFSTFTLRMNWSNGMERVMGDLSLATIMTLAIDRSNPCLAWELHDLGRTASLNSSFS